MDKKDKKAITKKKRKRRKKDGKPAAMAAKKEPGRAIIARLRLADNGIDGFHTSPGNNREALIQFLQLCTPSVRRPLQLLFHDLLLRSYLCHCVWSVITAHNLTPEKRGPPSNPTSYLRNSIQLITGISPCCG